MLRPLSPWLVLLNVEAVDSTVLVYLVHAVFVAPFSVSLCNSFLSGAHLSVLPCIKKTLRVKVMA